MQSRLRMAALAIAATVIWGPAAFAGSAPVENKIHLDLQITGLGHDGCVLEIKPAHPSCTFPKIRKTIRASEISDPLRLSVNVVAQSSSADRDCSFTIIVKEPGRPSSTFLRGVRLAPVVTGQPAPLQSLHCFLNTATVASRVEPGRDRR